MSYLQQQMNYLKFDKRLLEINLKSGIITEEEHRQFLQNLKDEVDKTEKLNLDPGGDSDTKDSMNGGHHPADDSHSTEKQNEYSTARTPTNTDPFGSGY